MGKLTDKLRGRPKRKIRYFLSPPSGQWYFHIQGDNNKVISASEGYKNKSDMLQVLDRYFPEWERAEDVMLGTTAKINEPTEIA